MAGVGWYSYVLGERSFWPCTSYWGSPPISLVTCSDSESQATSYPLWIFRRQPTNLWPPCLHPILQSPGPSVGKCRKQLTSLLSQKPGLAVAWTSGLSRDLLPPAAHSLRKCYTTAHPGWGWDPGEGFRRWLREVCAPWEEVCMHMSVSTSRLLSLSSGIWATCLITAVRFLTSC